MVIKRGFVTQKSNSFAVRCVAFSGVSQCFFGGEWSRGVGASCSSSAMVG